MQELVIKTTIKHQQSSSEHWIAENCFITELSNSTDDPDVSIARARVTPGTTTRRHRLIGVSERYCIVAGKGLAEIGDLPPIEVGPGDVVIIPQACAQRITAVGDEDLVFLAICTPRFKQEAYEDIDDLPTE